MPNDYWSDYRKFHKAKAKTKMLQARSEDEREHWRKYSEYHSALAEMNELRNRVFSPEHQELAMLRFGQE